MTWILTSLGILASAVLIVFLGGGLYAYKQAFYAGGSKENINDYFNKNEDLKRSKEQIALMMSQIDECPSEDVYITAFDGTELYARYYEIKEGAPIQIMMHGYKGNAKRDMCGGHLLARKLGHNVLLIDQRGCGKSGGRTISFGVLERQDALSWARYLQNRFGDTPVFLVGVSMGGAVSLMATDMDLPKNVVGAIADCPYSSPMAIIKKVCKDRGMPSVLYPFVTFGALVYGHFNPNKEGAVKSVKNAKVPYLILHGEKDGFVPYEMATEIYKSGSGEKYLYCFEGADHGTSYMSNPERYEKITFEFVEKCLQTVNNRHIVDKNKG